jgi:hypothetical protein
VGSSQADNFYRPVGNSFCKSCSPLSMVKWQFATYPQGPFNLEILRMHSFRMFCCSLNVSPADIFRIYTQYGTLDYQQLSYGILHGPDVFNDSHGVNFGPISIHVNMNFEGRHKLQVAIVWLEGLESAYGRDFLLKHAAPLNPTHFYDSRTSMCTDLSNGVRTML